MVVLLRPGIPQNIVKSNFSLDSKKTNVLSLSGPISALCATYFTRYALKPVDRGLKNGHFSGFPEILTHATPNTVLASKLKLTFTLWGSSIEGLCQITQPINYKNWSGSC